MTSAKSMFLAQLAGAGMGCILAPATFFMIYYAFPDVGQPSKAAFAPPPPPGRARASLPRARPTPGKNLG